MSDYPYKMMHNSGITRCHKIAFYLKKDIPRRIESRLDAENCVGVNGEIFTLNDNMKCTSCGEYIEVFELTDIENTEVKSANNDNKRNNRKT